MRYAETGFNLEVDLIARYLERLMVTDRRESAARPW